MRETRTDANIDKSTNGYVMTRRHNSIEKKKRHPPDSHLVLAWGDKKEKEKSQNAIFLYFSPCTFKRV